MYAAWYSAAKVFRDITNVFTDSQTFVRTEISVKLLKILQSPATYDKNLVCGIEPVFVEIETAFVFIPYHSCPTLHKIEP